MAHAHIEIRRCWIRDAVRHPLLATTPGLDPLPADRSEHLRREAEELYWNELSWEQLTEEEAVSGGRLTEMAFPAFLAFIDGLLPREPPTGLRPHPEVVEEILLFLADRLIYFGTELRNGADSRRLAVARTMTARLIDLVLYRLHRLTLDEREQADAFG